MLRVAAVALLLAAPAAARTAPWAWPVDGARVVQGFSFSPDDPYAAGQHRGVVLAARPGMPVRAACGGWVVFSGEVGSAGPTMSVQCGAVRATYQGISAPAVRGGVMVARGAPLARVGSAGRLRLGARLGPNRYEDPLTLLPRLPLLGPAPRPRPRTPRDHPDVPIVRPRAVHRDVRPVAPAPVVSAAPRAAPAPLAAWLGAVLVALALPGGALLRRDRRRRARARVRRAAAGPLGPG